MPRHYVVGMNRKIAVDYFRWFYKEGIMQIFFQHLLSHFAENNKKCHCNYVRHVFFKCMVKCFIPYVVKVLILSETNILLFFFNQRRHYTYWYCAFLMYSICAQSYIALRHIISLARLLLIHSTIHFFLQFI